MIKNTLYVVLIIAIFNIQNQQKNAIIKDVEGLILHKYIKISSNIYCEMESEIFLKDNKFLFFQRAEINNNILKRNPELASKPVSAKSFYTDFLFEYSNNQFKNDLTISKFNYHSKNSGFITVSSPAFFTMGNDSILYSAYQFEGEVVIYNGVSPINSDFLIEKDCICYMKIPMSSLSFAVLSEAKRIKQLNSSQIEKMGLIKIDIEAIRIFSCE